MDLWTTSTTARKLECAESTVRKRADIGKLPVAVTLADGTRLFDPQMVIAYARSHKPRSRSRAGRLGEERERAGELDCLGAPSSQASDRRD